MPNYKGLEQKGQKQTLAPHHEMPPPAPMLQCDVKIISEVELGVSRHPHGAAEER